MCNCTSEDAPLGAGPESILPAVVMDSGLARCAPRNDEHRRNPTTHLRRVRQRKLGINTDKLGWRPLPLHHREWLGLMKIGTLLTVAIVSLSAVGGGLAVYVATTKYQTMDKVSVAQRRLEIVRAVGEIPRYMNPERGFATNIMFGPPAVDPKLRAELNDKYRKQTDGAREKMNQIRATLLGGLEDGAAVASGMDGLNAKFASLRDAMDKAIDRPAEGRRGAATKIAGG